MSLFFTTGESWFHQIENNTRPELSLNKGNRPVLRTSPVFFLAFGQGGCDMDGCLIMRRRLIIRASRLKLRQGWGQRGGLGRNSCPAGPKPSPLFPDSSCTAFNWTGHHLTCTGHSAANSKKWQKIKRNLDSTQFNWNYHHYSSHSAFNGLLCRNHSTFV